MTQNTSAAVMAQRTEPHDSLDFFPTPRWGTRALLTHCVDVRGKRVWEPACGEGDMSRTIAEFAGHVFASDVHDYGLGYDVHDFLMPFLPGGAGPFDWIITNPPFKLAEQFIRRGLEIAPNVGMLVRSTFTESEGRYRDLFSPLPPLMIAQYAERLPIFKGRIVEDGSTATAYCWMIWGRSNPFNHETVFKWIPPCRDRLERRSDYASCADDSLAGTLFEGMMP